MKTKKVLSVITSFAMVISLVPHYISSPMIAKADEEYYEDYTYDSWGDAFARTLWEFEDDENFMSDLARYELYDINSDGIPELFISSGEAHYSDLYVYAFFDGRSQPIDYAAGAYGSAYVVPDKGYVYYKGGNQGSYWTQVKQFNGRELTEVAVLEDTSAAISANYYGYKYNGSKITQSQYNSYMSQYTSNNIPEIGREHGFDELWLIYDNVEYTNYLEYLEVTGCADSNVTFINIPASVKGVPVKNVYPIFGVRDSLKSINVNSQNPYLSSIDGIVYDKRQTTLIAVPPGKVINNFEFPATVDTIGERAFWGNQNITSIIIPKSISRINFEAFGVTSLKSITVMNPHCFIEDYDLLSTISSGYDENIGETTYNGVIRGYDNSTAQQYAQKYGLRFESLGPDPASTTTIAATTATITKATTTTTISKQPTVINKSNLKDRGMSYELSPKDGSDAITKPKLEVTKKYLPLLKKLPDRL